MESLNSILTWIGANPAWAGLGVFLIAFFESLALVGLVLPGAAMMFGIGALVGTDTLALWPTLTWAAAGAIAGDGVSFWLGRRYHLRLKTLWPLRNHPELIAGATHFFYRHGGKSIFLGRFIGPMRPVIPAVAGMLEMPPRRFLVFNIISAILWAPIYLLPGILFATSLGLASEVASRLAVATGVAVGLIIVALWLLRLLFNRLHRSAYPLIQKSLTWANRHPLIGEIPAALLNPEHPEARGLTLLALLLLLASTLFALLAHASGQGDILFNLDSYLSHTFANLRTPLMDHLFVSIAQLSDWQVLLPLSLVLFAWLWVNNYRHAAKHWLAAVGIGALLSFNLLWLEGSGEKALAPLHSGPFMTAIAAYGFLSVLIARELPERRRLAIYALTTTLLLVIALARLYLGASRLSGVLGAITLGLAWFALLGIGYRSRLTKRVAHWRLASVALLTLVISLGWHHLHNHGQQLAQYTPQRSSALLASTQWWQQSWQRLPTYRADLRGYNNHPLSLQFSGNPEELGRRLHRQGWYDPRAVTMLSWLAWLNPETPLKMLPVLPQVHNGQNEALLLVKAVPGERKLLALRLWPSNHLLQPGDTPLWIGNVSLLRPVTKTGLTVPRTQQDFNTPLHRLLGETLPARKKTVKRKASLPGWDGTVLLLTLSLPKQGMMAGDSGRHLAPSP